MRSATGSALLEMNPSSQGSVPVSVVVPIKNEADNLPRCLESVRWADEIFVVDSGSTDNSAAVAEQHGARVVQFEQNRSGNCDREHEQGDGHNQRHTHVHKYTGVTTKYNSDGYQNLCK